MSTATKSLDRLSESRLVLSEDWLSVGIGLAVFLLALAGLTGTDFLGWVVTTSVWTDPAKALAKCHHHRDHNYSDRYRNQPEGRVAPICLDDCKFVS